MAVFVHEAVDTFNILCTDLIMLFRKHFLFTFTFFFLLSHTFIGFIMSKLPKKGESKTAPSVPTIPGHLAPLPGEKR